MAYLGNVPAEAYSSIDKQVITGDGGASYTLDHSVANENEIEVFVNNVRQEPSVAYTVSGTALTMTGNVESSDDFYVVFQGKAIQTTSHPEGHDLKARDGAFSGNIQADSYIITGTTSSSFSPVQITSSTSGIGELRFADTTVNAGYVKYEHSNNDMVFATNVTERMRIKSSGNVGIGTTSPASKLNVSGKVTFSNGNLGSTLNDTVHHADIHGSRHHLDLKEVRTAAGSDWTNTTYKMLMRVDNTDHQSIDFVSDGSYNEHIDIRTGNQVFNTRFTQDGKVSIGQTDGNGKLNITSGSPVVRLRNNAGTSGYFTMVTFRNNAGSGEVGSITRVNDASIAYNTSSDHRLKENAVDMTGAITRVKNLQPKRFNFISDATDTLVDGFMAHEAATVVPEAVTGTHNEVDADGNAVYQGIDQSKLVPLLTGALQEAIAKIEALETRVQALEDA